MRCGEHSNESSGNGVRGRNSLNRRETIGKDRGTYSSTTRKRTINYNTFTQLSHDVVVKIMEEVITTLRVKIKRK